MLSVGLSFGRSVYPTLFLGIEGKMGNKEKEEAEYHRKSMREGEGRGIGQEGREQKASEEEHLQYESIQV